ncbi:MAG: OFA family MFS transporter [Spirochaetes bacterium]|mgnify:FL=1|jgi:MFS family permease|nr:OFA family MFS transporter [Spirochaetota bacterium]MBP8987224.1 OFA family MFS transporter [Spirochaetota bacterium]HQL42830.1 OFA family MFS transporter [Spirochaetota bacterium]HQQ49837.1 OFA family MFS transporter [Spirochaetota bacterium]
MTHHNKLFGLSPEAGRWIYVITGLIICLCLGSVYAYSIFLNPIINEFSTESYKLSASQGNLPFMVFLAFFSILMFFAGKIMDKLGPKKLTIYGGLVVGLGWALSYYAVEAKSLNLLILTYGVIAGSGVGVVYGCPLNIVGKWFPDKKGLTTGLVLAGFGGSALITGKIANILIQQSSLSLTFLYFGIGFAILLVLLAFPFKSPEAGWKPQGWTPSASAASNVDFNSSEMVKTSTFWGLFLAYLIGCLAGLMAIGISKPVGSEIIKIDGETATTLVGIFAIFNALGRPLFGWLTDKISPKGASILNLLIIIAVSIMMLVAKEGDVIMYVIAFCGFWLILGGWLAIAPTTTLTFYGVKNYSRNYGIVFFAYGLGAILGGVISGQAKDAFGSYQVAFWPTLVLGVIGLMIVMATLKPPVKKAA